MMTLPQLLHGMTEAEAPPLSVTQLSLDSRAIAPGAVFLACAGERAHGLQFAMRAAEAGAAAVLYDPVGADPDTLRAVQAVVPCIAVPRLGRRAGTIAARAYDHPAEQLTLVGVTGTDGKSSVVNLWAQLMRLNGHVVASLGTLGLDCDGQHQPGRHTTPDPVQLQAQLAAARDAGCTALAMEVSSHAIAQGRVDSLAFAHVALTTLGRDHLDYHASVAEYHATKRRLLAWPGAQTVHINGDMPLVRRAWEQVRQEKADRPPYTARIYGGALDARWHLRAVVPQPQGLRLSVTVDDHEWQGNVPLYGEFNASNLLAAASLAEACGADIAGLLSSMARVRTVPGRMETVRVDGAPLALVDYAHTPEALDAALRAARAHRPLSLICVFGCGGERDRGKRPLMAAAAERHADTVFVTDDNPRHEDPEQIFGDIRAGFRQPRQVRAIHDRAEAITQAVAMAGEHDIVLVAGKGHEQTQQLGDDMRAFSDVDQLRRTLREVRA